MQRILSGFLASFSGMFRFSGQRGSNLGVELDNLNEANVEVDPDKEVSTARPGMTSERPPDRGTTAAANEDDGAQHDYEEINVKEGRK